MTNNQKNQPIGILDSGIGGLSILRELHRQLPSESVIYFADQIHIPYGLRTLIEIRQLTVKIVEFLLQLEAKLIVLACNTASAAALHHLRHMYPSVPFVGMEPAVKPAATSSASRTVGVMATPATFQGELYATLVARYAEGVQMIEQICPGLIEQVEKGEFDSDETIDLLERYLNPLVQRGIDTLVLGCTHYPFLIPAIRRVVGPEIDIIDPSPAVARQVSWLLHEYSWVNDSGEPGITHYLTSGEPIAYDRVIRQLGMHKGQVQQVNWIDDSLEMG